MYRFFVVSDTDLHDLVEGAWDEVDVVDVALVGGGQ